MRAARSSLVLMSDSTGSRSGSRETSQDDLRVVNRPQELGSEAPTVLLVEDNLSDAELVRAILERAALYQVQHVTRAAEAVGLTREAQPSCILLDLTLPDADGLEGLRLIRESDQAVPIILLTGHDEALGVQALQEGAQDYL